MILNLPYLERKAISFTTHEYVVEKALPVSNYRFRQITADPMQGHQEIQDNIDNMYYDGHQYHCLLIYDKENGDGLLVESEGYSYARYAQYIPQAKLIWEQFARIHAHEMRLCCPLDVHCSYTRGQILVALDFMKPDTVREGVKWLPADMGLVETIRSQMA